MSEGSDETKSVTQIAFALPGPKPTGRALYEKEVFIVEIGKDKNVRVQAGHITSWECSHEGIDNVEKTVVWFEHPQRMADNADDAHTKTFKVADPHLIMREEAHLLGDPWACIAWFRGIYSDIECIRISERIGNAIHNGPSNSEYGDESMETLRAIGTLRRKGLLPA